MIATRILILFIVVTVTRSENYEPCDGCKCELKGGGTLRFDCSGRNFTEINEDRISKLNEKMDPDGRLILIFANNKIDKLSVLPKIDAATIDITLRNNNMGEIVSGAFVAASSIRYLDLGYNRLTGDGVRGDTFRGPFNVRTYEPIELETLNLEHNLIHSLDKRMFEHTPKLKVLRLNDNPLKVLDSVTELALHTLQHLEILDLSRTGIASLPSGTFKQNGELRQLFLSGNEFRTVPEAVGVLGSSLRYLSIGGNPIERFDDESFIGLWRVEHLEACDMRELRLIDAGTFVQMRGLRVLRVCNSRNLNRIDRDAFRELKDNWPIREIHLNNNSLRTLHRDSMRWGEVRSLNLDDNPWDCDCEAALIVRSVDLTSSRATCATPAEMGGLPLSALGADDACDPEDADSKPKRRFRKAYNFIYYTRPSNVLIAFSAVFIVGFIGTIVGVRMRAGREKVTAPVRYTNMNGAQSP